MLIEIYTNVAGKWQHVKDTTSIGEGKMFSPGNLRATFDNPEYDKVGTPLLDTTITVSIFLASATTFCA